MTYEEHSKIVDLQQQLSQLQQENQQLKEKLLKIFENIDISYNEWKKWKGELSKLNDSYSSEIQELLSIIGGNDDK